MSNGYKVNANKSYKERKFESKKYERIRRAINSEIMREHKASKKPSLGPRTIFYHYVYDLKWSVTDATKEVLKEFPSLTEENILKWLKEKEEKKEEKGQDHDER